MAEIAGLKLIVPSSVSATGAGSSASVSASGKVTFSSADTLAIDGCFSSTYDNYLFVCRYETPTNNAVSAVFRSGGSDATGANYTDQYLTAESTSVLGNRQTSQTNMIYFIRRAGSGESGFHTYFYGPALAQPTAYRTVHVSGKDGASVADSAGTHSLSTAYDGIKITGVLDDLTGALTIYGLSQ